VAADDKIRFDYEFAGTRTRRGLHLRPVRPDVSAAGISFDVGLPSRLPKIGALI